MRPHARGTVAGGLASMLLAAGLFVLLGHGPAGEALVSAAPAVAPLPQGQVIRLPSGTQQRAVLLQEARGPVRGVVLALGPHGLTSARAAAELDLSALRDAGYAVAWPSTLDGDWNAGRCCGRPQHAGIDDVQFLMQVRAMMLTRFPTAAAHVGVLGYSTGGQMAYRVLCEQPGFASAAVVVSGSLETSCRPGGRLPPTLVVHGLRDSTVPWAFTLKRTGFLDYAPRPALSSLAALADAGRCSDRVLDRTDGRWLVGYRTCRNMAALTAVGMPQAGHEWGDLLGARYTTGWLTQHLT